MASKSAQDQASSSEDIEELLDGVDKNLERVKTLYEQYFLGIQKQAPTFLHTDIERKLRELTQLQVRNTGLRYRLATLQQKFGAYNSYWKRTLRQIENGTYLRNLSKIGREAIRTGAEIPEEILAAMPKRMREQVTRDREAAIAIAKRRRQDDTQEDLTPVDALDGQSRELPTIGGAHVIEEDGDFDMGAFFASLDEDTPKPAPAPTAPAPTASAPTAPAPTASAPTAPPPLVPPPPPPVSRQTGPIPLPPHLQKTARIPLPPFAQTQPIPAPVDPTQTQSIPVQVTQSIPVPDSQQTQKLPLEAQKTGVIPNPRQTGPIPIPPGLRPAPSQASRPNPIAPGAAAARGDVPVESMKGPFPRPAPKPAPTPQPAAMKPPPGMTDADVNTLYQKYVQAKQLVGEAPGPREREKLLKTINAQAPKIMEQYKAKGVDFSVVVKDNQVIIRAKPKT